MVYLDINLILFRTQEGLGGLQSPSLIAHTAHTAHTSHHVHAELLCPVIHVSSVLQCLQF